MERFWRRVRIPSNPSNCWEWTGHVGPNGYGTIWSNRTTVGAHRFSYELHKEPIPSGMQIDHLCRNRKCVNPDHLEVVTPKENTRRGNADYNRHKTSCPKGHPYDEKNTYVDRYGYRICRRCRADGEIIRRKRLAATRQHS